LGFFAPSFVTTTVRDLQKVFIADACHLHFGKNTLFSCYGITANAIASHVAFAIILGSENTSSWRQFWNYAVKLHPYLDSADVTIITDQTRAKKRYCRASTIGWALPLFLSQTPEHHQDVWRW
jgi:hypothetical protein